MKAECEFPSGDSVSCCLLQADPEDLFLKIQEPSCTLLPAQAGVPSCNCGSSQGAVLSHRAVGSPGPVGKLMGKVRAVSPEPSPAWPALPGLMLVLIPRGVFSSGRLLSP